MFRKWKITVPILGMLLAGMPWIGIAAAQKATPDTRAQDKVGIGQAEVTQLLALMDTDKNGKISKQEFMKFMEAEFDRLDKDKSGELDPRELIQMQRPVRTGPVGK